MAVRDVHALFALAAKLIFANEVAAVDRGIDALELFWPMTRTAGSCASKALDHILVSCIANQWYEMVGVEAALLGEVRTSVCGLERVTGDLKRRKQLWITQYHS